MLFLSSISVMRMRGVVKQRCDEYLNKTGNKKYQYAFIQFCYVTVCHSKVNVEIYWPWIDIARKLELNLLT